MSSMFVREKAIDPPLFVPKEAEFIKGLGLLSTASLMSVGEKVM